MSADRLTLGGRDFEPMTVTTIEHDFWLMSRIRAAGLDAIEKGAEESPEEFVARIMHQVIDSGSAFEVLGGMLIPAQLPPQEWTPAIADETAKFIRELTDPIDKTKVQSQMIAILIGFFANGLTSLTTSRKSSGQMERRPGIAAT
jgi:hypothetical protein